MYCASTDIIPLVPQSKLRKMLGIEGEGDIPASSINPFIVRNSQFIDTRLGGNYVVPITGTQALQIVKGLCVDLTVESLYAFNSDGKLPENIKAIGDNARLELDAYGGTKDNPDGWKTMQDAELTGEWLFHTNAPLNFDGVLGYAPNDRLSIP